MYHFLLYCYLFPFIVLCISPFSLSFPINFLHFPCQFLFFSPSNSSQSSTFTAILSFPTERRVLHKERLSGTFRLSPYFFAKTIAELPMLLLLPLIFTVIAYWMGNLNPDFGRFVGFLAALLVCVMAGESLGLLIGAVFLDMQKGTIEEKEAYRGGVFVVK